MSNKLKIETNYNDDFISSIQITEYKFGVDTSKDLISNNYVKNSWPIVYIIKSDNIAEAYIGESTNVLNRMQVTVHSID